MQIAFGKVGSTAKPVEVSSKGVTLHGTLQKSGHHQVVLDARLTGSLDLHCDRCGNAYNYQMDTELKLKLSDLLSEDKDDLDIIEFLDGTIDLLYILESEITSVQSTYHYCRSCDGNDETLEIEF